MSDVSDGLSCGPVFVGCQGAEVASTPCVDLSTQTLLLSSCLVCRHYFNLTQPSLSRSEPAANRVDGGEQTFIANTFASRDCHIVVRLPYPEHHIMKLVSS